MLNNLSNKIFDEYEINKEDFFKTFWKLSIIAFAYLFPLYLRRVYFLDDILRSLDGALWDYSVGRPFANFFISLPSFKWTFGIETPGEFLDAVPFNILIATLILCLSLSIYGLKLFQEKSSWFLSACLFFFIANPFMLQGLAWQFDCIYTTTAIAIALFASIPGKNRLINLLLGIPLLVLAIGSYQTSLNVFMTATVLFAFVLSRDSLKSSLFYALINAIKAIAAALIYKFGIVNNLNYLSDYYREWNQFIALDPSSIKLILIRLYLYSKEMFKWLIDFKVILGFIAVSILAYLLIRLMKAEKFDGILFTLTSAVVLILTMTLGFIITMKTPFFEARVLSGFSLLLLLASYCFYQVCKSLSNNLKILILLPLYSFFFISYSFSNLCKSQESFNTSVARRIQKNLYADGFNYQNQIAFEGRVEVTRDNRMAMKDYRLFEFLYRGHLGGEWYASVFFQHLGLEAKYNREFKLRNKKICTQEPLIGNYHYKIFREKDFYLVSFPIGECYRYKG